VRGNSQPEMPGVGAHRTHVLGTATSRAVACATCHRVPKRVLEAGHLDSLLPAEVALSGVAAAFGGSPEYIGGSCANTSCHGAVFPEGHASGGVLTEPSWTQVDGTQAACGTCHGLPPPPPHPYVERSPDCSTCHENVSGDNRTFVRPDLHVDGQVTFTLP
jgi:predicted CxxxxCH...CXXCH cytochrome family protein